MDNNEECWKIGSDEFNRREVECLLHTQRAMIINDMRTYCGNELTDAMNEILDNPRKPEY